MNDFPEKYLHQKQLNSLRFTVGPSLIVLFLFVLFLCAGCYSNKEASTEGSELRISGKVINEEGRPVVLAVVRKQASTNSTMTDTDGTFVLDFDSPTAEITVSAWKDGYYCAKQEEVSVPSSGEITLVLRKYQTTDNPEYEWMPPEGEESCDACKPEVTEVWLKNAHANAAKNARFLSMYKGTSLDGKQSPQTEYAYRKDYGDIPLKQEADEAYYGPGYKLDFPDHDGNCAACHTPGAAVDAPYGTDPTTVTGADEYGVHCDYCHKAADVTLNPETGLPYPKMPGVLSMELRRPFPDDPERFQLFFGTFDDDNVPEEDTKLPLLEESRFCAPCHFGEFWDTVAYNSYGEWLKSPYSRPDTGKTCQDCHMPAPTVHNGEVLTNVAEGAGGVERNPMTIHGHYQLGATDKEFLEDALTMNVALEKAAPKRDSEGEERRERTQRPTNPEEQKLKVSVELLNDNTGHHIPTGTPLRHMILLVRCFNDAGEECALIEGPKLPEWCGEGPIENGAYAGCPGKAYAKVLREVWTGKTPTGAYWTPTTIVKDNRLAAFEKDTVDFVFSVTPRSKATPSDGTPSGSEEQTAGARANGARSGTVEVTLLLRRAFYDLMEAKGWDTPDMVMKQTRLRY